MTIPVELVNFTAKKSGNANKLAWQTASELNNNYFDVQRSTGGATFQNIGQVKGAGNSIALNNYEFMDETPTVGTNYYRLQQVDVNGKTTTSKTVAVNTGGKGSVNVFSTLATDKLNVLTTSEKEERFDIVNLVGQTVLSGRFTNATDINISQLAKGTYILHIAGEAVKFTKQ
jgi:Secretion system C-terminal sorting domain